MSGWVHRFHGQDWQAVDVLAWIDRTTAIVVPLEPGDLDVGQPITVYITDLHRYEPEPGLLVDWTAPA